MHQHAWLIFVFLVETGFHHIGQVGLELLTSSDPAASASESAGITGLSHHPRTGSGYFKTLAVYYGSQGLTRQNRGGWKIEVTVTGTADIQMGRFTTVVGLGELMILSLLLCDTVREVSPHGGQGTLGSGEGDT